MFYDKKPNIITDLLSVIFRLVLNKHIRLQLENPNKCYNAYPLTLCPCLSKANTMKSHYNKSTIEIYFPTLCTFNYIHKYLRKT